MFILSIYKGVELNKMQLFKSGNYGDINKYAPFEIKISMYF